MMRMIDWGKYKKRRRGIDEKRREIERRGAKKTVEALILRRPTSSNPELEEWAIAFVEYFEGHPGEWEGGQSLNPDPPKLKDFKEKIENFLDLFGKVRPK